MYRPALLARGTMLPVVGGDRAPIKLVNGVRNTTVFLVMRATVTVTIAAAAALRNRGSVAALFDEIVIDENGTDKLIVRGNVLRFLSEMAAPSALSAVRAGTAVAVYNLEEAVAIQFADPLSLDPLETAYVEHDSRQVLNVSARVNANPNARLYTVGGATVVVNNISVAIEQEYDNPSQNGIIAPLFIPTIRQTTHAINGAVTQEPDYIRTTNLIRKIVVSQEDSVLGEVGDILTGITLRGDFKTIFGTPASINDLLLRTEFGFGGAVVSSNRSHLGFSFQRYGQLSECLNPAQDVNLRFEYAGQPSPSGVAAGGTSQIRVTYVELFRDPAVCAPKVPFPY